MNGTGRVAMVMVMAGVPLVKVYHLAGGRVGRSWGFLGRSWDRIEALRGLSWASLGQSWRPSTKRDGNIIGPSEGHVGGLWDSLGPLFGPSWGALGALLGALGAVLGPSGAPLGPLLGHLGGHRAKETGALISIAPSGPEKSHLGAVLGRSWGALGRSWGRLGPLLGLSWGRLGPSWSHLEASRAHRKRKGEKAKNIGFSKVFEGFWPLGGLLGRLLGLLKPS